MPQSTSSISPSRAAARASRGRPSSAQRQDGTGPEREQQGPDRKRKRSQDRDEDVEASPSAQRQRLEPERSQSPIRPQSPVPLEGNAPRSTSPGSNQEAASDPVDYWRKHHVWPSSYFESEDRGHEIMPNLRRAPSQKDLRSDISKDVWDLHISVSGSDSSGSTDTRKQLLGLPVVQEFFEDNSDQLPGGLPQSAQSILQRLKTETQTVPAYLNDTYIARVFERSKGKLETKVVVDVGPLVVPRVEQLYFLGDDSLGYLTESVDELWSHCIPLLASNRPTPDYAAGFHYRKAFTEEQRSIIKVLGPSLETNFYSATKEIFFPFFTCEAKAGSSATGLLVEAEKQNVETSLIGMRGVIELFKRAKREHIIEKEILAFSAVYTDRDVAIYAHFSNVYPEYPKFFRHQIAEFRFPQDEWASYKLIKNIYKIWVPLHYQRICDAIQILGTPSSASSNSLFPAAGGVLNAPNTSTGRAPKAPSSATGGAPGPRSSPMAPPPPRSSASGTGSVRSQRDLTPNTSPTRDVKKPKTLG